VSSRPATASTKPSEEITIRSWSTTAKLVGKFDELRRA